MLTLTATVAAWGRLRDYLDPDDAGVHMITAHFEYELAKRAAEESNRKRGRSDATEVSEDDVLYQ